MQITEAELNRCKRAVVVLADIAKAAMRHAKTPAPLEMKEDMQILMNVLRRLEPIAKSSKE